VSLFFSIQELQHRLVVLHLGIERRHVAVVVGGGGTQPTRQEMTEDIGMTLQRISIGIEISSKMVKQNPNHTFRSLLTLRAQICSTPKPSSSTWSCFAPLSSRRLMRERVASSL